MIFLGKNKILASRINVVQSMFTKVTANRHYRMNLLSYIVFMEYFANTKVFSVPFCQL